MVDVKTGNQLLYLPLEKLVSQVSEGAAPGSSTANSSNQAPAAQSPSSTTTQVTPAPNADKRENLRSRERDAR
jgi:membrane protease subunit HflK